LLVVADVTVLCLALESSLSLSLSESLLSLLLSLVVAVVVALVFVWVFPPLLSLSVLESLLLDDDEEYDDSFSSPSSFFFFGSPLSCSGPSPVLFAVPAYSVRLRLFVLPSGVARVVLALALALADKDEHEYEGADEDPDADPPEPGSSCEKAQASPLRQDPVFWKKVQIR